MHLLVLVEFAINSRALAVQCPVLSVLFQTTAVMDSIGQLDRSIHSIMLLCAFECNVLVQQPSTELYLHHLHLFDKVVQYVRVHRLNFLVDAPQ